MVWWPTQTSCQIEFFDAISGPPSFAQFRRRELSTGKYQKSRGFHIKPMDHPDLAKEFLWYFGSLNIISRLILIIAFSFNAAFIGARHYLPQIFIPQNLQLSLRRLFVLGLLGQIKKWSLTFLDPFIRQISSRIDDIVGWPSILELLRVG